MTDRQTQQTRARAAAEPEEAGFDVWLPALVAIATAFFLILSASAQQAPPRPIYDAERFAMSEAQRTLLEERAARAAAATDELARAADRFRAANARVEMRALPPIYAAIVDPVAGSRDTYRAYAPEARADEVRIGDDAASVAAPGWLRLVMALAIAAMLGGALYMLDRTWRRTGPITVPGEAAA